MSAPDTTKLRAAVLRALDAVAANIAARQTAHNAVINEATAKRELSEALIGVRFFKIKGEIYENCPGGNLPRITILDLDDVPAPEPVHTPHNRRLTPSEGFRLLDEDEYPEETDWIPETQWWNGEQWTRTGLWNSSRGSNAILQTRLTRSELAARREGK